MAKYAFPAIFHKEKDGKYWVEFPDIACDTQGDNLADAIYMAEDSLSLVLCAMEDAHDKIPTPSPINSIKKDSDSLVNYIAADTLEYRKKYDNKAVKKTLSIPEWMNTLAVDAGLNFSQILQDGIRQKLNIG